MSKNTIIIALVVLGLLGTIWGSIQDKKSTNLERQLAAMKQEAGHAVAPPVDEGAAGKVQEAVAASRAEAEELKKQNKELLTKVATLKGNVAGQREELAALKHDAAGADNSQVVDSLQAKLDDSSHIMDKLEAALSGARAQLEEKSAALAVAEAAVSGFENVKSSLANSVDAYSAKNQELSAELEAFAQRVHSLENALEERTKRLVAGGEELARTKLNMNVLLSKIAAQNDSLAILEETRIALERELVANFQLVQELQQQLNGQGVVEGVIAEEIHVEEVAAPAAEGNGEPAEEAPAH